MHLVWRSLPSSALPGYAREGSSAAVDYAHPCASLPLDAYERVYSDERVEATKIIIIAETL